MKIKTVAIISIIACLTGCNLKNNITSYHGYSFAQNYDEVLQVNIINKQQVINAMGTPSFQSHYDDNKLFYIGYIQQNLSFTKPKTTKSQVLTLVFDKDNILKSKHMQKVNYPELLVFDKNTTNLPGNKISVVEQLLSNVGKFNKQ